MLGPRHDDAEFVENMSSGGWAKPQSISFDAVQASRSQDQANEITGSIFENLGSDNDLWTFVLTLFDQFHPQKGSS